MSVPQSTSLPEDEKPAIVPSTSATMDDAPMAEGSAGVSMPVDMSQTYVLMPLLGNTAKDITAETKPEVAEDVKPAAVSAPAEQTPEKKVRTCLLTVLQ